VSAQRLAGRNALVLGVERPLGRRVAVALAEAGANVAVVTVSEDTQAEFAANSTANEFWAIGVKGIALTSDGRETSVREAIADATAELGPISILTWHAPPLPRDAIAGVRSDPAIVVLIAANESPGEARALAEWTRELAASGLRANAVVASERADDVAGLAPHESPAPMDVAEAAVYFASDETAAIEGTYVATDDGGIK
jgi:NAD(P)-dependent dehydrogenase (short-subunit alcohol dehydrogenase family)